MQAITLPGIDLHDVEACVDQGAFARGVEYAKQHAVVQMQWTPARKELRGLVRGSRGAHYQAVMYFGAGHHSTLEYGEGECECPVGYDCKHVVALVVTAARAPSAAYGSSTWEQALDLLLPAAHDTTGNVELAVELTMSAGPPNGRLRARLVKPGKNGWISALSWNKLGFDYQYQDFRPAQVRFLRELHAIHRSHTTEPQYGYGYGDQKTLDLSEFHSPRLWQLLPEADSAGIRLVHGKKMLGALAGHRTAQVSLDAVAGKRSDSLVLKSAFSVDGMPVDDVPVGFIGGEAHGVVYVSRAEFEQTKDPRDWHLRLAELTKPVPGPLQDLVLGNQPLAVPAADLPRFREHYFPRLRRTATIISSDGSFTPPSISEPTLVLRATYRDGHELDVNWEWAYEVGDSRQRAPLHSAPQDSGYRDLESEQAILDSLDFPVRRFRRPGTDVLAEHTTFSGIDTLHVTTELLPLIDSKPGLAVEVHGEAPEYREVGDSLRIGVSTKAVPGDADWFDLGITIDVEGRRIPFTDVFVALSTDQSHLLLPDGGYFSLEKTELLGLRRLIEEARALQESPADGPLKISRFQAGLWSELAALGVVDRQAKAWKQQVTGLLSLDSAEEKLPPETLVAQLRPYQLEGFRWLAFLWEHRLGGILADDMGLGKTLQSLALICHAKQQEPALPPFLIVAPTSVVSNWAAEAARFTPGLKVVAITDTMRRRGENMATVLEGADLVITSYTLFRLDFEGYSAQPWAGLVLDEAQFTKNHQSKIYQCARRLPTLFKLAITGTPMENSLMELWSLLSITAPGLFPTPERFRQYYAVPIEKEGATELLTQLRKRIKPLVKRRTKEQVVSDLPAKQEQVLEVELHPRHRKIYQTQLQRERQKVLNLVDDLNKNRFTILSSLTLLRQLSLHAGLVDDAHQALPSAKIDALLEQLEDVVEGGHRALVFSQFTGFLAAVRERLDAANVEYCYLDGKTRNRAAVLKRFKEGAAPVFLVSLKAGGVGLNLTEADYCFLLDPWWNPATEAQAVDRTHRIGQTRNVMVYRLIAKDTIEEKVMALKNRKAELFASVMDDGNAFGGSLDAGDIRELFA